MTCPGLDWINSVIGEQIPWTCFTPLLLLLCCFPSISVDKTIQSLSNNCAYHLCCFFLLSSNTSILLNRMKLHLSPFVWALFEYLIPFLIRYSRSQACCRLLVSCLSDSLPIHSSSAERAGGNQNLSAAALPSTEGTDCALLAFSVRNSVLSPDLSLVCQWKKLKQMFLRGQQMYQENTLLLCPCI